MTVLTVFGIVVLVIVDTVSSKAFDTEIDESWNIFKTTYNKSYRDVDEEALRKTVYIENKLEIDRHNKLYEDGVVTFTLRMNRFGDLTQNEYVERLDGFKRSSGERNTNRTSVKRENVKLPKSLDWRTKGYVTDVKDEGPCVTDWAFSAVGALEGQFVKESKTLVSLSAQQLLDCGIFDCGGGRKEEAYKYIIKTDGIESDKTYPYKAEKTTCRYHADEATAQMSEVVQVEAGDDHLLAALVEFGPVAVSMDATLPTFKMYGGGVYSDPKCQHAVESNHAMLAIGYGTTRNGEAYWLVKNSWGTGWGEHGYIRMSRDMTNICGLSSETVYPVI